MRTKQIEDQQYELWAEPDGSALGMEPDRDRVPYSASVEDEANRLDHMGIF